MIDGEMTTVLGKGVLNGEKINSRVSLVLVLERKLIFLCMMSACKGIMH